MGDSIHLQTYCKPNIEGFSSIVPRKIVKVENFFCEFFGIWYGYLITNLWLHCNLLFYVPFRRLISFRAKHKGLICNLFNIFKPYWAEILRNLLNIYNSIWKNWYVEIFSIKEWFVLYLHISLIEFRSLFYKKVNKRK